MKLCVLLLLAGFGLAAPLPADTIYQTNAQGRRGIVQRDAIVLKDDSTTLIYKHFDLKERRVEKVSLSKSSLPYSVDPSDATARRQIVDTWKRFGFTATIVDLAGKSTRLFDVYLDFYPPGGRGSLLESVPARTTLPVLIDGGAADEIDFSKITLIDVRGAHLAISLRDGQAEAGQFLMPTDKPAEVRLLGITDHYDPASPDVFDLSVPLAQLKEIRFE